MSVYVETEGGSFAVDVESGDVEPWEGTLAASPGPGVNLPRVVATAAAGSTIAAVVDAKPPILVSYDGGATWRASGRGLPPGRAIAVSADDPDLLVYAARNRLYVSRNGGVFWTPLDAELPAIKRVAL